MTPPEIASPDRQSARKGGLSLLFEQKRLVVAFPPGRFSDALRRVANAQIYINRDALAKSVFPDQVRKSDGYVLHRPTEWR